MTDRTEGRQGRRSAHWTAAQRRAVAKAMRAKWAEPDYRAEQSIAIHAARLAAAERADRDALQVKAMHDMGAKPAQIADALGLSSRTVYRMLKRELDANGDSATTCTIRQHATRRQR